MASPTRSGSGFRIRWIDHLGVRQSASYATKTQANAALRRNQTEVQETLAGIRKPPRKLKTFHELTRVWIENRTPQKRSAEADQSITRAHLVPFFGTMELTSITQLEVDRYAASRHHLAPKTVHNHLTLLIAMLNYAEQIGWLPKPCTLRKTKVTEQESYRFIESTADIAKLLKAAYEEGIIAHFLYATAYYTGMRAGELAGLTWDDVNLSTRQILVKRSYSGPTKSGRLRRVPIVDPLYALLTIERARAFSPYLFPNENGGMLGKSARLFQEVFQRVQLRAGFAWKDRRGELRPPYVFHDLRHTFASHFMMAGGDLFKLQKILGHQSMSMTMRYAHLAPDAFNGDFARLTSVHQEAALPNVRPLVQTGLHNARDFSDATEPLQVPSL